MPRAQAQRRSRRQVGFEGRQSQEESCFYPFNYTFASTRDEATQISYEEDSSYHAPPPNTPYLYYAPKINCTSGRDRKISRSSGVPACSAINSASTQARSRHCADA